MVADHHKMLAKFTVAWKTCFYWTSLVHYRGCCSVAKSCPTLWPHELHQAPVSSTISWNLLKLMSIESVMLSNHLSMLPPSLPSVFPSVRIFSSESALCSAVQFSCSVLSNSLRPHGLQHARLPCPSPTPGAYSNSCPLHQWCHSTISSSVVPFSCLQSFPASGSFPMSRLFTSVGQSIGASASVLSMSIEGWFPLGLTGLISLPSKRPSKVFFSTTVRSINSSDAQPFLLSSSHIHT